VEKWAYLDFNKAEYEVLGNFDDTRILEEPCDEMEEPIYPDDRKEDNILDKGQEQVSDSQPVARPDEMQGAQL